MGVDHSVVGVELCGNRSSGELGIDAATRKRVTGIASDALRVAADTLDTRARPSGHRNVAGDEMQRRQEQQLRQHQARAPERARERGELEVVLTALQ